MDILNELAERFAITLETQLCNDSNYLKAMAQLHELSEGLPAEKATELDDRERRLRDMKPFSCPCHVFLSCDGKKIA